MSTAEPHFQEIETLYSDHHAWLYGWLRKKLDNRFDAADLAQDTFLRIFTARQNAAATIKEPRAFLTTVAKGLLVNWYRRAALERAYLNALALLPEPQTPSPEERFVILETLQEIDAMLDALPPLVKRTFLLSQLEGMQYSNIAQHIGVSLITVKRYMKQAFLQCLIGMNDTNGQR